MSSNGWISLHRSIQNHWLFQEKRKFSKFEAWVDLLLLVNHADGKTLFREELVTVKRGQHVTSIRKLCDRWGWSNNKVKNFFTVLEEENMLQVQSDSKKTLVTVVNYEVYQSENLKKRQYENQNEQKTPEKSDSDATDLSQQNQGVSQSEENEKRQQSDSDATVMHTNNNDNNDNNDNKKINKKNNVEASASSVLAQQVQEIWNHYLQTFNGFFSRLTLTENRKKVIKQRLKDPHPENKGELLFSVDDIKLAISNIRQSPFHCGDNDKKKFYAHIDFICRNADMVEKWINETPKPQSQPQQKKNVVPFNKQKKHPYNPASQLPKSIREAEQRKNQPKEVENPITAEEIAQLKKEIAELSQLSHLKG